MTTKLAFRLLAVLGVYLVYRSIACGTRLPLFYFDGDDIGNVVGRVVFYYALPFAAYLYVLFRSTFLVSVGRIPRAVSLVAISVALTVATLVIEHWWCQFVLSLKRY